MIHRTEPVAGARDHLGWSGVVLTMRMVRLAEVGRFLGLEGLAQEPEPGAAVLWAQGLQELG